MAQAQFTSLLSPTRDQHLLDAMSGLRIALQLRMAAIALALIALGLVFIDYANNWTSALYSKGTEAKTNPLTVLAFLACFCATALQRPMQKSDSAETFFWLIAVGCAALFPISATLAGQMLGAGAWGETGWNTAAAIFALAGSQLIRLRLPTVALMLALLALGLPMAALNGYLIGFQEFRGAMSLGTIAVLMPLVMANLMRFARHRFIAPVLRRNHAAFLLRLQLLLWVVVMIVVPMLIGLSLSQSSGLFPLFFTMFMAGVLVLLFLSGGRFGAELDMMRRKRNALLSELARDPLTGLANRETVVDAFARAHQDVPLGLILIDIDNLRRINDNYGHTVGDVALRNIAEVLKKRTRVTDVVARWGKTDFLILCRADSETELLSFCHALHTATRAQPVIPGSRQTVTVSIGAVLSDPHFDPDLGACLALAESALKDAKSHGRNGTKLATMVLRDAG